MKQEVLVLNYIVTHGSITPLEAILELHITRLAAVVFNLKRKGHRIETVIHRNGQKWWAEYRMKKPLPGVQDRETARTEGATLPSENITLF